MARPRGVAFARIELHRWGRRLRSASSGSGVGPAADIFWNVSTWHPYSVVLIKAHIEAE